MTRPAPPLVPCRRRRDCYTYDGHEGDCVPLRRVPAELALAIGNWAAARALRLLGQEGARHGDG